MFTKNAYILDASAAMHLNRWIYIAADVSMHLRSALVHERTNADETSDATWRVHLGLNAEGKQTFTICRLAKKQLETLFLRSSNEKNQCVPQNDDADTNDHILPF
jgi:hypothetical protein